ncbi:MAG: hypothetical protein QNJ92_04425 [Alphaproteobacteria bacterium]|nr:hypothetical protein [Alphaproteobacteria bacterium]
MTVLPGLAAPRFKARSGSIIAFDLERAAGDYCVVAFVGSCADAEKVARLECLAGLPDRIGEANVRKLAVTIDPADQSEREVHSAIDGISMLWDFKRDISLLYEAATRHRSLDKALENYRPHVVVVDPELVVLATLPLGMLDADNTVLSTLLQQGGFTAAADAEPVAADVEEAAASAIDAQTEDDRAEEPAAADRGDGPPATDDSAEDSTEDTAKDTAEPVPERIPDETHADEQAAPSAQDERAAPVVDRPMPDVAADAAAEDAERSVRPVSDGPSAGKPAPSAPPVVVIPKVLKTVFCRRLVAHFEERLKDEPGGAEGGDVVVDLRLRGRREMAIADAALNEQIRDALRDRLGSMLGATEVFGMVDVGGLTLTRIEPGAGVVRIGHETPSFLAERGRTLRASIVLNGTDFKGGAMRFPLTGGQDFRPHSGDALIHPSHLICEVEDVTDAPRYALSANLLDQDAAEAALARPSAPKPDLESAAGRSAAEARAQHEEPVTPSEDQPDEDVYELSQADVVTEPELSIPEPDPVAAPSADDMAPVAATRPELPSQDTHPDDDARDPAGDLVAETAVRTAGQPARDPRPGGAMSDKSFNDHLAQAYSELQTGRLREAEQRLLNVLDELEGVGATVEEDKLAKTLNALGGILRSQDRPGDAIAYYERAMLHDRDSAELLSSLGTALADNAQHDAAVAAARRAVKLAPEDPQVRHAYASVLAQAGQFETALEAYDHVVEAVSDRPEYQYERACVDLQLGRFSRGWDGLEARWEVDGAAAPKAEQPEWDGSLFQDKRLLLYPDQGVSASIQCLRYLPHVKSMGGEVVVECDERLISLLRDHPGIDQIIAIGEERPTVDLAFPLLSLPRLFSPRMDAIPQHAYLKADPGRAKEMSQFLDKAGREFRIGLVWSADERGGRDRQRALRFAQLARRLDFPGAKLFSLQTGRGRIELRYAEPTPEVVDLAPHLQDYADAAAAMDGLDLMIMVDGPLAHLAGAMGKPTWLMLPHAPHWVWLTKRKDSPWYPTLRLFRQSYADCWDEVLDHIGNELQTIVTRSRMTRTAAAR